MDSAQFKSPAGSPAPLHLNDYERFVYQISKVPAGDFGGVGPLMVLHMAIAIQARQSLRPPADLPSRPKGAAFSCQFYIEISTK